MPFLNILLAIFEANFLAVHYDLHSLARAHFNTAWVLVCILSVTKPTATQ